MKVVPLISSGIAGALGVLHLPRLWQKASLAAVGKLHDDYPAIGPGYDQMVLDCLAIDKTEFEQFIRESKPTYPQLEVWIRQENTSIDKQMVDKCNAAIAGYHHSDSVRAKILRENGMTDDGTIMDACNLNNLDDWLAFHKTVIKTEG